MGTRELALVLCLLGAGMAVGDAQAQSSPPPAPHPPPPPHASPFSRTMSTVVTVAISIFFFVLFLCAYINQCRLADPGAHAPPVAAAAGGGPSRRGRRGLDPAVVATFPIVSYREIVEHKISKGVLECAVCLTAFEDGDDLRLLPHCSHAFHPECIDPWLGARVTCPLCRANLEKPPPAPAAAPPSPAAAPPSPEHAPQRQPSPPPEAVAIPVAEEEDSDEDDRKEEAMELEMLRSARRAARMPKSHSTGHSLYAAAAAAAEEGDHERFTLRLPHHVREEVLRSRRLRHATSLINLSDMSSDGSSRGGHRAGGGGGSFGNGGGGGSSHGGRRWQAFLARTVSWARGGADGPARKGWDGSTRRGRDNGGDSSRKGAASPTPAAGRP
ncbi:hypothetical protein ACP70R_009735 [Stipagrostis hirtigluma subsp. patula]